MLADENKSTKMKICSCTEQKGSTLESTIAAGVIPMRNDGSKQNDGCLIFRPVLVQKSRGPHIHELVYATDQNWDTFRSDIVLKDEGIIISDTEGHKDFGINVRWQVEGFGAGYITADNGGDYYQIPASRTRVVLNLNFELAKSRVARNQKRLKIFLAHKWNPSREVKNFLELSQEYLGDASKVQNNDEKCGQLAQKSLFYALWGSEMMELEKARFDIASRGWRKNFYFGCDARNYYHMPKTVFMERFKELFNYANLSYVVNGDDQMLLFEPQEGKLQFELRDLLFQNLRKEGITVGGRLLFWFHHWVTPEWLKKKSFDDLKKYVEKHTREVIGHYGDGMYAWEIVNEFHDWANEVQVTPEQALELTRLACEVARDTAPQVKRLINNCCPFAEYVQLKQWSGQPALYPQRTPWQFTRDLVEVGVDFDIIAQQVYFPYHDLQDTILMLERYEVFQKPVQLSEVGAPGGLTKESVLLDKVKIPNEPYIWHRNWDEELQADWLEQIYTLAYSKPFIEAVNWFDFIDIESYMDNGGLLTADGKKKAAFDRLLNLQNGWRKQV